MLRRPVFWIVVTALSVSAAIFTLKNFSTAFPLVSIDLRMDRADALQTARSLAEKNAWPSQGFNQAAEFSADQEVQNFIELEGGGKPELSRILREKIFAPYTWRVRFFKEADAHETSVRFTPEGEPYGFRVKLPDQERGESKPVEEAQRIAELTAKNDWNIDFNRYGLIESSKELRPGGRMDHTFVYERQDERIRDGRYRLRLVIGGDKLTELTHFVQIPEAFTRRYEQMRSANDAINAADSIVVFGLYILAFCGIGLFFMIRQHWVLWRQAALWGVFIAFLMGLQVLNSWPLLWMNYDTAVPASGFVIRQIMTAVATFGAFAVLLTITFMAAETLSRRAFPHHVQFWKVWSRPISGSAEVAGQTVIGYLLVALFFAYEIVLYFFAQGKLGWWTPSDTLVNPDMFANYVPSLSAVSQAAQAGFWEECLFRAVPLATAALIGDKIGRRRPFIIAAMVLQALVFGAGHAGYANQPAYARVVELIIPSFAFGTLYLIFGLLPGIVLHFAYDTVWIALPLFVSSTPRAHIEQALVILIVLIPFWVVLVNRIRLGAWRELPDDARNGAWKPRDVVETVSITPEPVAAPTTVSVRASRALRLAGAMGLIAWIIASPFRTDAPPIRISRGEVEQGARRALAERGAALDASWTVLSRVDGQPGEMHRFVWQTAGRVRYEKLLGVYLPPPSWMVRFARFNGDVAERAEEYQVYTNGSAMVFRVSHDLPEAKAGANLTVDEARGIAVRELIAGPAYDHRAGPSAQSDFKEVSAQAAKRPARTDWTFVFKDTRDYGLPQGEPRVSIVIAGDQAVDAARYIYVPEDWSRNERARRNLPTIVGIVCTVLIVAIVVAVAAIGAIHWSRKRAFSAAAFFAIFSAVFFLGAMNVLNSWPVFASQASTAQPLALQIGIGILTSLVFGIFTAIGLGLVAGLSAGNANGRASLTAAERLAAISAGLVIAGAGALARHAVSTAAPLWGNLGPASAYFPFVAGTLGPLGAFFTQTLIFLAVLYVARHRPRGSVVWLFLGIALAGSSSIESIPSWMLIGASTGLALMIAYQLVFRHHPKLLAITTATLVILSAIREGVQHMYPSAVIGSLTAAVVIAITAWLWFRGSMRKVPYYNAHH
jgi:hypothetical protein